MLDSEHKPGAKRAALERYDVERSHSGFHFRSSVSNSPTKCVNAQTGQSKIYGFALDSPWLRVQPHAWLAREMRQAHAHLSLLQL